ncbi:hypothetical protein EWM64_g6316 [Hericium alpestre]|uniref:Uncharacterized protein n=1 Tax=Hericium alpestre TaxID=135208 RepID=A0A4Y9ZUG1_9AGAM|nr:hypothetical protein EWM64_g6316 [Hericium alpestre]
MDESGQEQAQEQAQERFRHLSLDAPPTQQLVEQDGAEPPTMDIDDIFGGGLTPLKHRTSSMDEDSFPSPPLLRQKRKPSASPPKSESNRPKRPVIEPSHIVIEPHVRHDEIERRRLEQAAHEEEETEAEDIDDPPDVPFSSFGDAVGAQPGPSRGARGGRGGGRGGRGGGRGGRGARGRGGDPNPLRLAPVQVPPRPKAGRR